MKTFSPAIGEFLLYEKAQKIRGAQRLPITMVVKCSDARGARLMELFDAMDERGRVTLLRLAQAMPKNDSIAEICDHTCRFDRGQR